MSQNYYMYNGRLYSADELKHWKYTKKLRINGKWYYYYDDHEPISPFKEHKNLTRKITYEKESNNESMYGKYKADPKTLKKGENYTMEVVKGNSLFTERISYSGGSFGTRYKHTTVKVGKLRQFAEKAKNWLLNLFS